MIYFTESLIIPCFALTVSVEPSICSGTIPNAVLEPYCLRKPTYNLCSFTCKDGYGKSDAPDVIRGNRWSKKYIEPYLSCKNGTWTTYNEKYGYGLEDLCLPEGKCVYNTFTVLSSKSDCDVIFCLQSYQGLISL